jgi:DNA repair protein RadC
MNYVNEVVENLYLRGTGNLSDSEILAIAAQIDVELAKRILIEADYQLTTIARLGTNFLKKFDGIGDTKAAAIVAAIELGRRRLRQDPIRPRKINSSVDVWLYMKPILLDEIVEHFYILILNRNNEIMKAVRISSGGTSGTVVDPKMVFKHALEYLGNSIILVHNHPSGNVKPSEQDRRLTDKLKTCGYNLDLPVIDHVIFGNLIYFSFADEGLI